MIEPNDNGYSIAYLAEGLYAPLVDVYDNNGVCVTITHDTLLSALFANPSLIENATAETTPEKVLKTLLLAMTKPAGLVN